MSTRDLLVRQPVTEISAESSISSATLDIAKKAHEKLQYSHLYSQLVGHTRTVELTRTSAQLAKEAFRIVGFQPYSNASVTEYKKIARLKTNLKYLFRNFIVRSGWSRVLQVFAAGLGVLGVILMIAGTTEMGPGPGQLVHPFPHYAWCALFAFFLPGVLATIGIPILRIKMFHRMAIWYEWRQTELSRYTSAVPEFALSKALELKEVLGNEANFSVDWLQQNRESYPPPMPPDPFLVLHVGQEMYYIDVWDEKDFEKK